MGLFSTLGKSLAKIVIDSASGIQYANKEEINSKAEDFVLHYQHLLNKTYDIDDKLEIVMVFALTSIAVSKSDGNFSNSEVQELLDLIEGSVEGEISREEALELIKDLNKMPITFEVLTRGAMEIQNQYGDLAIETLRKFIEYMIYSDGEVHPKELEFLKNWTNAINIQMKY